MTLRERLFGPSLTRELMLHLKEQATAHVEVQKEIIQLMRELAAATAEQSKGFGKYLDLVTPSGPPQVHEMDDYTEARLEQAKLSARHVDVSKTAGMISAGEAEREMLSFFQDFKQDMTGMA